MEKPNHRWCAIVWDADRARRPAVIQAVENSGAQPQIVEMDDTGLAVSPQPQCCLALVALDSCFPHDSRSLEVIRKLKQAGLKVVAYADGVDSWPIRIRCLPLLAGASELLDSKKREFAAGLRQLLKRWLTAETSRKAAEESLKSLMMELGVIGESSSMIEVFRKITRVSALSDLPVLITGETGTGKERLARAMHRFDPKRREGPFVAINCGAISPTLAESELFGHRRGAFTGADRDRKGLFRAAQGGVLFLDEIGELNESVQAKLLRVLQENRVLGVGEERESPIDVRVVAATNRNLLEMVDTRIFRADLFHRLNVIAIHVPPLRERPADIQPLIQFFLKMYRTLKPNESVAVAPEFAEALTQIDLPGNVRQLENLVRQALVNKETATPLNLSDLPPEVWEQLSDDTPEPHSPSHPAGDGRPARPSSVDTGGSDIQSHLISLLETKGGNLALSLHWCERLLVEAVLQRTRGNQSETARLLGITARSVYNKIRKHQLR